MRAALVEMRAGLRLGWGHAPVAMVLAIFLSLLTAVSTAASAAVQRALVDSAGQASPGRIVVLALLAGLVFTTWLVLQRLGVNLWSIVNDRTVPELRAQTLALCRQVAHADAHVSGTEESLMALAAALWAAPPAAAPLR